MYTASLQQQNYTNALGLLKLHGSKTRHGGKRLITAIGEESGSNIYFNIGVHDL
jgi:hypothetical protein